MSAEHFGGVSRVEGEGSGGRLVGVDIVVGVCSFVLERGGVGGKK
jgi:hypothetical protein